MEKERRRKVLKVILLLLLVSLYLGFLLTSCGMNNKASLSIKPHEFSEDAEQVIELLDEELDLWDVSIDDTVKSFEYKILFYENGEWDEGGVNGPLDDVKEFSIGFSKHDKAYRFITMRGKNRSSVLNFDSMLDFSDMTSFVAHSITEETEIEKEKEIVVYAQYGFKSEKTSPISINDDYKNVDCDKALVVTLTLSDQDVDDEYYEDVYDGIEEEYEEENGENQIDVPDEVEKNIDKLLALYPDGGKRIELDDLLDAEGYEEILKMQDDALQYMLEEFENGRGEKNRGMIMMYACREILGSRDNVEGKCDSGLDWYKQFSPREEVKLGNFKYSGEDEILDLVYNKNKFLDEENQYLKGNRFSVSAIKVYETIYEGDYLKVFCHIRGSDYILYKSDEGAQYILEEDGGFSIPYAITYKKNDDGVYYCEKYDEPKDGAYYASSIEDFCVKPVSKEEIDGLAETLLDVNFAEVNKMHFDNLEEHLKRNGISNVVMYDPYGEVEFEIE